jgi:hypothetical protein
MRMSTLRTACPTSGSRRCRSATTTSFATTSLSSRKRSPGCGRSRRPCRAVRRAGRARRAGDGSARRPAPGECLRARGGRFRLLDWGDTSIAHPFASLVVPFRFLEEINRLPPTDRWFERLREAYLEPWGSGFGETFALAVWVGAFAYPIAWSRQRDCLPEDARPEFDKHFSIVLRRAIACAVE